MNNAIIVGKGQLTWPANERRTDRYGSVLLYSHNEQNGNPVPYAALDTTLCADQKGTLVAVILESRASTHIGDLFRGIRPHQPKIGDEITLGKGMLFYDELDDDDDEPLTTVGIEPEDGRDEDWMDPQSLYNCHQQTVELRFIPSEQ
jgi:hypothetical protein